MARWAGDGMPVWEGVRPVVLRFFVVVGGQ